MEGTSGHNENNNTDITGSSVVDTYVTFSTILWLQEDFLITNHRSKVEEFSEADLSNYWLKGRRRRSTKCEGVRKMKNGEIADEM